MKNKSTIVLAILVLLISAFTIPVKAATTFSDVSSSYRAAKEIYYLAEGNIITGSNGSFHPNSDITRAEAVSIIGRAVGLNGTQRETRFVDVPSTSFASGYIQSAFEKGFANGYSGGYFKPGQHVTRGEMALFISKAFGYHATTTDAAINELLSRHISEGMANGDFGGKELIKRADFAVFVARAINDELRPNYKPVYLQEGTVTASSLLVRKGPSTIYGSIGSFTQNTKLNVSHTVGNWIQVTNTAKTVTGFVSKQYVTLTDVDVPEVPTTPPPTKNPLAGQTIVIDPGHGGTDPGALGSGLREKDVVLDTGLKVRNILKRMGISYYMTRETDVFIVLQDRPVLAQSHGGDTFVSIHANKFNGAANGTETYYYGAAATATNPYITKSKLLAQSIQKRLLTEWQLNDRKVKTANYYVLKYNSMPSSLAELGFIDNPTDAKKLGSSVWRERAAEAIVLGILDYYKASGYNVSSLYDKVRP
ncbi:N-acetylmuramoyl-L-alanine amidase [Priestia koreensis]|uniref:N-acetylmuramoyl-L-alanine amidase n=1 Tax=Priestia koreensis TaxID=284581 RepID=UPI0006A9FA48|nr:N-acetylmuramoyl-L-alanine amidase [Priestia koreensis]